MAEELKLPKEVVKENWKDDVDVDYAIYGDNEKEEMEYINPTEIDKKKMNIIEAKKEKLLESRGKKISLFFQNAKAA